MIYLVPIFGALLWGLWFNFAEETLGNISLSTWYLLVGLASVFISLIMSQSGAAEPISFKPFLDNKLLMLTLAALVIGRLAELLMCYALKELPATYVAFAEVSYPLFVPVFAYLIFGQNQFTPQLLAGSLLIMGGIYCIMMGQHADERDIAQTAHSENRVVALQDVYDKTNPAILWNRWAQALAHDSPKDTEAEGANRKA